MNKIDDIITEPSDNDLNEESQQTEDANDWQNTSENDTTGTDDANSANSTYQQEYNQGEQSISGSTPDPSSDDDILANAQAVGSQLNEDEEHPEELDLARDINQAELHHHTH